MKISLYKIFTKLSQLKYMMRSGVKVATEMLDDIISQYLQDTIHIFFEFGESGFLVTNYIRILKDS